MNWDDLRFLVTLGREGTLAAAARRLAVDQTTVARRLRALEEGLGTALFERDEGLWRPTAVGARVLERAARTPVVLPITSGGNFARTAGFTVSLMGSGTQTTGVVRCDQPRALDIGSRRGRKLESVPQAILDEVLAKVATLFE